MARHPNRARVYSVNGGHERSMGKTEAMKLVESGQAIRLSRLKADQLVIQMTARRDKYKPEASISLGEMEAIAGLRGPRRKPTRVAPVQRRNGRIVLVRQLIPNALGNYVDRAMTKIEMWPLIGDTKAVRARGTAAGEDGLCPRVRRSF